MRTERLLDRFLGGHVRVGPLVLFGRCAMHWAVTVDTKRWGRVCFRLPLRCFGRWWPLYLYCSPNATPWAATFLLGRTGDHGPGRTERALARQRRICFGHNFSTEEFRQELRALNNRGPF